MPLLPIIIAVLVLIVAITIYHLLPAIIDYEMTFLWAVGIFFIFYIGAAIYLTHVVPSF
ncbi:MAG: hypothetical protein ABH820_04300 [Patescibacteria group bacterium]|nr:hypothetical protein [Patescibacteria group bacterium]MBU2509002.1 hypothetical protein [Patescibacteria group bacterium]